MSSNTRSTRGLTGLLLASGGKGLPCSRGATWLLLMVLPALLAWSVRAEPAVPGHSDAARMSGGLVVHVGDDPEVTASLGLNDRFRVQGLYRDGVAEAREAIAAKGLYGRVSVAAWEGKALPYSDNLVNLLVVDAGTKVDRHEVLRVLAPRGVAIIGEKKIVKPVPADIDDWTHYLHGPDNNAVARDARVAPPYHTQWEGGPRWQRSHDFLASLSALVSSEGKLFYIHDEGERSTIALPAKWFLVARDAFNGIILWKRPIRAWESQFQKFRVGPVDLSRRLVAVGGKVYVTLGYGEPVSVLDAGSGETLMQYKGTEGAHEIIVDGNVVYVTVVKESAELLRLESKALRARLYGRTSEQAKAAAARLPGKSRRRGMAATGPEKSVMAVDAGTGAVLWEKSDATEGLELNTLTAGGRRVFYQNAGTLFCLDAGTGAVTWQVDRDDSLTYGSFKSPTVVLHKDVLLWAAKDARHDPKKQKAKGEKRKPGAPRVTGILKAYSVEAGRELWSCPTAETFHAPFEVFVMEDLVWTGGVSGADEPGLTEGRDYRTGKVLHTRPPSPELYQIAGHASCYRNKATEQFLLMNRAGIDFIDVKEGKAYSNHFARGACQYGILPANGYVYTTPHSCNCYIYAKLSGYVAMAGKRYTVPEVPDTVLEKGPAYGNAVRKSAVSPGPDWPTYRFDSRRSSAVTGPVSERLRKRWEADLKGNLTPPVVANSLLYVADRDTHTLHVLEAKSGDRRWRFIAGGEIDSPPTIHDGYALFGSADGWVYCLEAASGDLVWRFRAAPNNQQIISYGQIESVWPVPGSILAMDHVAYFVAGRTSYMDGGMFLYKVDVKSGRRLAVRRLYDRDLQTDLEKREVPDVRQPEGALPDILSSDGESIFLRHRRFDLDLNDLPQNVPHLFSTAGFLDDDWWHRTFWQIGIKAYSGFSGWASTGQSTLSGQLLSFDDTDVYGFGHKLYGNNIYYGVRNKFGHYRLYRASRDRNLEKSALMMSKGDPTADRKKVAAARKEGLDYGWEERIRMLVRSMVLTEGKLVVAGAPDVIFDEPLEAGLYDQERVLERLEKQHDVYAGRRQGILMVVSVEDGGVLAEQQILSPPVFNGMIVAGGDVFIADMKGRVSCYQ